MASAVVLVSRAEFDARTAAGERLEYDAGEVIEMANNNARHERLKGRLTRRLNQQTDDAIWVISEATCEVAPDRVRQPDIAVFLRAIPDDAEGKIKGAPDLAIEIVSPSDKAEDLIKKIRLYLDHGAKAAWAIYPDSQQIDIHQAGQPTRHYVAGDILTGEEPVPQFTLNVSQLFDPA